MSAVELPDANYGKVSDGDSLFPITPEWVRQRFFFFDTKERVTMLKDVSSTRIETFLMEWGARINLAEGGGIFSQQLKEVVSII